MPQSKFTELCNSASVVPQSKFTELCTSAFVVPHSKSTELCSAADVVPKSKPSGVNLPGCEARRRHMACDIFGTGQRNILALCYLFAKTYKPAHSNDSNATQVTEINTLNQITGNVIDVSCTHIPLKALMIPLKRVKLRGVV